MRLVCPHGRLERAKSKSEGGRVPPSGVALRRLFLSTADARTLWIKIFGLEC